MLVRANWFRRALSCEVIVCAGLIASAGLTIGTGTFVRAEDAEAPASAVAPVGTPSVEPVKMAATTVLLRYTVHFPSVRASRASCRPRSLK